MEQLMHEIHDYWMKRADGYSRYNQEEWKDIRNNNWRDLLLYLLETAFPNRDRSSIRILDAGCGPGFFTKILAESGYEVCALDCTENMIKEAKQNMGTDFANVQFVIGDVEDTKFEDLSFDVVLSRNVTWNLRHPKQAYAEWFRLLESGGLMINFDANWYGYLFDAKKKEAYEQDRILTSQKGMEDCNVGENFDKMEVIARKVPLSQIQRPEWDETTLKEVGFEAVSSDCDIWQKVWSEDEKVSCASTPMFMILARKSEIKTRIKAYWGLRSESFGKQKRAELHDPISERWLKEILKYADKSKHKRVLDVGCGAGFFSILLAKQGFEVTGIDLTEEMITQAKQMAAEEAVTCDFHVMDAENLEFDADSFDLIISRNLTWTLPHPDRAYKEWMRVLKAGGMMLNFDANYGVENTTPQRELPPEHAHNMLSEQMLSENGSITRQLPISFQKRPAWDIDLLSGLNPERLTIDFKISERIYMKQDQFYNPAKVFLIAVEK